MHLLHITFTIDPLVIMKVDRPEEIFMSKTTSIDNMVIERLTPPFPSTLYIVEDLKQFSGSKQPK